MYFNVINVRSFPLWLIVVALFYRVFNHLSSRIFRKIFTDSSVLPLLSLVTSVDAALLIERWIILILRSAIGEIFRRLRSFLICDVSDFVFVLKEWILCVNVIILVVFGFIKPHNMCRRRLMRHGWDTSIPDNLSPTRSERPLNPLYFALRIKRLMRTCIWLLST